MAMDALFTGVSGLQVNQEMLDVVGNNLANSNTSGYKSQSVNFSDLVYQNLIQGTSASGNNVSGTNPIQVGSGAQVSSISTNLTQGTLQTTGNTLDMALQGNGYFVVNNGGQQEYTRAGSFGIDSNNDLVDPATGALVQRFGTVGQGQGSMPAFQVSGNNNIQIPVGTGVPGAATTSVTLQGNLSATASGPVAQVLTSLDAFLSGNNPATLATTLNSLGDNTTPYQAGDSLTLTGTTATGTAVNATVPVGPATTVGDLVNAINTNFPGSTATLNGSGNLVVTSNTTGPTNLSVVIGDTAGNVGGTNWSDQSLNVSTAGADGTAVNTSIQVYDAQGTAHTLNLVFQKQSNNTWDLTGSIAASDGTMVNSQVTGITFNQNGSFSQAAGTGAGGSATMSMQFTGFAKPQAISFNFGTVNGFDGVTQSGGTSSAVATGQNGYAPGVLSTLSIAQDGTINGVFTNGQTLAIAQIAVANFADPSALTRNGDNYFSLSNNSGPPLLGVGLTGGRGAVEQGQLESSNVDVSLEFTRLIIAQQGFEVNAHVITTASQIMQDLANIIH
jgi:flagellar hook protein FlgE